MSALAEPLSVAVLEDESGTTDNIRKDLETLGPRLHCAKDFQEYVEVIDSTSVDAASVDLYIRSHQKGREALDYTRRQQPDTATVVFTQHDKLIPGVAAHADQVVSKNSREHYRQAMRNALQLGRARRIVRRLRDLGETILPQLPQGATLANDLMQQISDQSREVAMRLLREGKEDLSLRPLLLGAGWWRNFYPSAYAALPAVRKLQELLRYAGIMPDELRHILAVEMDAAAALLGDDAAPFEVDSRASENADQLLSILSYLLRLADYNPELLRMLWSEKAIFASARKPAPWDDDGLRNHLEKEGPVGLRSALTWIRSH